MDWIKFTFLGKQGGLGGGRDYAQASAHERVLEFCRGINTIRVKLNNKTALLYKLYLECPSFIKDPFWRDLFGGTVINHTRKQASVKLTGDFICVSPPRAPFVNVTTVSLSITL